MKPTLIPKHGKKVRVIASLSDKNYIDEFLRLTAAGAEIVTTGGTSKSLKSIGVQPVDVEEVTGVPEMFDGRVKILHPAIFGGLLANLGDPKHLQEMLDNQIDPVHAVFINFYPFEKNPSIENIDVGGPSAVRAAVKNGLIVVVDPADNKRVVDAMLVAGDGTVPKSLRNELVTKAFRYTARYEKAILDWFETHTFAGTDPYEAVSAGAH